MSIVFALSGIDSLKSKLAKLDTNLKQNIGNELKASALKILTDAKRNAPVNFGTLRNSITLVRETDLSYSVEARANYAPYVEFGTGGQVSVPSKYADYAMTFKGKKGGKFAQMKIGRAHV